MHAQSLYCFGECIPAAGGIPVAGVAGNSGPYVAGPGLALGRFQWEPIWKAQAYDEEHC